MWDVTWDRNVEGGHSTQKPVECMERPIRNHEGDVYDPFVGSGTSIIAAERPEPHLLRYEDRSRLCRRRGHPMGDLHGRRGDKGRKTRK